MEKSSQNITFSDLKGLEKLPEKLPILSRLFYGPITQLFCPTNETVYKVYKVQDNSYGIGFHGWEGDIIEIDGKIFPNGKGYFHYEDGTKIQKEMQSFEIGNNFYTGECKNGEPEGFRVAIKGECKNGEPVVVIYKNGASYKAKWENGELSYGEMIYPNDASYIQEPIEDEREDDVTCNSKNGASYKAKCENGKRHGKGKLTFPNGSFYEGIFKDGEQHGQGYVVMIYEDGTFYKGEWENGKRKGWGKFTSKNGDCYEGQWLGDNLEGWARCTYQNGDYYESKWKNGKQEGDVICTYENGTVYIGGWENDKPHGWGTMNYPNGDSYKGTFQNGTVVDFSEISIRDSNYEIHTITKKNGLYYSQVEGKKEQEIDINIENKEILQSLKMKDPEELRKSFIDVRLPHEFNVICEKLKELRNESKGDESLSDQKPRLLIITTSYEQVTNWLSKIMSGCCC